MLLANGALNVLAKIVSSTREDEHGEDNMQLEALSVMFNLVKAGYGSAQSHGEEAVLLGTNELDFVTEKLLCLLHIIADNHSQLMSRQEIACKVIKQISGFGGQTL